VAHGSAAIPGGVVAVIPGGVDPRRDGSARDPVAQSTKRANGSMGRVRAEDRWATGRVEPRTIFYFFN
jgi:hypothetical protein